MREGKQANRTHVSVGGLASAEEGNANPVLVVLHDLRLHELDGCLQRRVERCLPLPTGKQTAARSRAKHDQAPKSRSKSPIEKGPVGLGPI